MIVTTKKLFEHAYGKYAIGAYNVNNLEQIDGLFKGNLQALVGQMYDNEKYGKLRDSGFSIFYMFNNNHIISFKSLSFGFK